MLTRQQMVDVIHGGGAVHYRGRIITKEVNLPSAAELARTPEEKESAKAALAAQIAEQQGQLDALNSPNSEDGGTAKADSGKKK